MTSPGSVYFISFKDGWYEVTATADKKKVLCRASSIPAAMQWVRQRLDSGR